MLQVFLATANSLVTNDMLQAHERQSVDDLGLIDQSIDIELSYSPPCAKCKAPINQGDYIDIVIVQVLDVANQLHLLPRIATTQNVEIIRSRNDASD